MAGEQRDRGFGFETTTAEVLEGVDLTGQTAVVTGASTGLGLETARALASAGAHVVLAVRSADKGAAAADKIRDDVPDASLEVELVDLTSLESVRAFAERVRREASEHPAARQQRGCDVHARRAHGRGFRAAVRHEPRGALPPHQPAGSVVARGRAVAASSTCRRVATTAPTSSGTTRTTTSVRTTSSRRTGSPRRPTSASPSSSTGACATGACARTQCIPA